eukprot:8743207-Heterocapsa_arctica.AAC.1
MNKKVLRETTPRDARASQGRGRRPGDSVSQQVDTLGEHAVRRQCVPGVGAGPATCRDPDLRPGANRIVEVA